jgi:hypothetical protein
MATAPVATIGFVWIVTNTLSRKMTAMPAADVKISSGIGNAN